MLYIFYFHDKDKEVYAFILFYFHDNKEYVMHKNIIFNFLSDFFFAEL